MQGSWRNAFGASLLVGAATTATVDGRAQPSQQAPADQQAPAEEPAAVALRYEPAGTGLAVVGSDGARQRVELGCPVRGAAAHAGQVIVACGGAGVVVLVPGPDGQLAVWSRLATDGEATDVFVREGRPWVVLRRVEARPVGPAAPSLPAPAPVAPPVTAERPTVAPPTPPEDGASPPRAPVPSLGPGRLGRVVAAESGEVIIDLGEAAGLAVESRVRLASRRPREMGAGHVTTVEETLAVGEVVEVAPDRARVRLGLNENVPVGASAQPTRDELSRSLIAPPRPSGQWHLGLHARPFLALGDLAFGVLSQVEVGYRGASDWHVRVLAEPLGFAVGKDVGLGALSAMAAASYDHQLFEVGAGVGATRVATDTPKDEGPVTAFSIVPMARLGALDGFHLEVHNGFVVLDEGSGAEFGYGSTHALIQIPLARPAALQLRGGGGISGHGFGELGLRVLAAGNGGHGTVFVTPSLGAAFMFGDHDCETLPPPGGVGPSYSSCSHKVYGGPMVGLGLEVRP